MREQIKPKIKTLEELVELSMRARDHGSRIVLCHGTFDLLHVGHVEHFEQAAGMGDLLLVTLTGDRYVNKGPDRPVFNEQLRARHIAALECVDAVAVNQAPTAVNILERIQPDIYVKGGEHQGEKDVTGRIQIEKEVVDAYGGEVRYTSGITSSSTFLLNNFSDLLSNQVMEYLAGVKRLFGQEMIFAGLESLRDLKVLVVGDAIIDEYHYVYPLGQTGKNSIMAAQFVNREQFAGGAIAVANHVSQFAGRVTLLSALGESERHEEFIRSKLANNLHAHFITVPDAPTLRKLRYVTSEDSKLFEVYFAANQPLSDGPESEAVAWLESQIAHFDLVVVPDYGNGFITQAMVDVMSEKARYLAVNTQINSGNRGFHFITRYPHADFVSLNEQELRMAFHDRHSSLEQLAQRVAQDLGARHVAVTRGVNGVMSLEVDGRSSESYNIPALSTKVLDRIGAGDAFLALAALALAGGVEFPLAMLIGAAAAALDVQIVCNREPVKKDNLINYLKTLLK